MLKIDIILNREGSIYYILLVFSAFDLRSSSINSGTNNVLIFGINQKNRYNFQNTYLHVVIHFLQIKNIFFAKINILSKNDNLYCYKKNNF